MNKINVQFLESLSRLNLHLSMFDKKVKMALGDASGVSVLDPSPLYDGIKERFDALSIDVMESAIPTIQNITETSYGREVALLLADKIEDAVGAVIKISSMSPDEYSDYESSDGRNTLRASLGVLVEQQENLMSKEKGNDCNPNSEDLSRSP